MTYRHSQSIAASGLALLSSNYTVAVFNIVFSMILLRLLTTTEFAVVVVLEILTALAAFSDFGLNTVFLQRSPSGLSIDGNRAEALGLIRLAVYFRFAVLCILGLIMSVLAEPLSNLLLKTPDYAPHVRLLVVGVVMSTMLESFKHVAQAAQDFRRVARWTFWMGVSYQIVGLALYAVFGFCGYLYGLVVVITAGALSLGWVMRAYWINDAPVAPLWANLKYGFPFFVRTIFRFGFMRLDQLLVGILLSPNTLAIYSVAKRLTSAISMITEAFNLPIFMRSASMRAASPSEQGRLYEKAIRYVPTLIVPVSVIMAAASPWLMYILGGEKYVAGWPILVLLCLAEVGYVLSGIPGMFVFTLCPPWATLVQDAVIGTINYLLAPLLILSMGVYGVAIGRIIGFAVGWWLSQRLLRSCTKLSVDWSTLRRLVLPLSLSVLVVTIGQQLYFTLWVVPLYMGAGTLLFVLALGLWLDAEDWQLISEVVPKRFVQGINWAHRLLRRDRPSHT